MDSEENMRTIFKRNKKLANQKRNKFDINAYMVFGLAAYLTVSAIIFIALMMYDTGTSSELSKQNVVATILQATLAAAALFGVSIAVLFVAKNTDKNAERQASAHELAAETASLDRVERYLLEAMTPLLNIKNNIDDLFVFANIQRKKFKDYFVMGYEEIGIVQWMASVYWNQDSSKGLRGLLKEDKEYYNLQYLYSILSSNKDVFFGINRDALIDVGLKQYLENPHLFFEAIRRSDKEDGADKAVRAQYDYLQINKEDEDTFFGVISSGGINRNILKYNAMGDDFIKLCWVVIAWHCNKCINNRVRSVLEFLLRIQVNEEFAKAVAPKEYNESDLLYWRGFNKKENDTQDVSSKNGDDTENSDEPIVSFHDYEDADKIIYDKTKEIYEKAISDGFKGKWSDWYLIEDLDKINYIIANIYSEEVMGLALEGYLRSVTIRTRDLYLAISESMKMVSGSLIPMSYVLSNLKNLGNPYNKDVWYLGYLDKCLSQAEKVEKFMTVKEVTTLLTKIKGGAIADLCDGEFLFIILSMIKIIPYVTLDVVKPLANIEKKILNENHTKDEISSPLIEALRLDASQLDHGSNANKIKKLKHLRKIINPSIFSMSKDFWLLQRFRSKLLSIDI